MAVNRYKTASKRKGERLIREHVVVAERALGKPLPSGAVVHHANGIKCDNRNSNLVICQDASYHMLLHYRMRIVKAGGNPDTEKICTRCRQMKLQTEFSPAIRRGEHVVRLAACCKPCSAYITEARRRAAGVATWEKCIRCDMTRSPMDMSGEGPLRACWRCHAGAITPRMKRKIADMRRQQEVA